MKVTHSAPLWAALTLLAGCAGDDETSEQTQPNVLGPTDVATVNGERLPESVFRLYSMNVMQRNVEQLSELEHDRLLDDLIDFKLLAQEADRRGLPDERTIAAEVELQRMQLLARSMGLRYLEENPPTEAELRAAYEANLDQYLRRQYKARHVLVESEAEAREIIGLLDEGGDFAALAQEHSTDSTASNGGDLGYFTAESMVPQFAEAVASMETGDYSNEPVQTRFGWHVILVEDIRDQEPPGVEAVRNELQRQVERQKLEAFVESLRTEGAVEVTAPQ